MIGKSESLKMLKLVVNSSSDFFAYSGFEWNSKEDSLKLAA